MGKAVRPAAAVLGVALLVLFFTFAREVTTDGSETRDESRIGVWFSPWGTWREVRREASRPAAGGSTAPTGGWERTWSIDLFSWSWPTLAAGLLLLAWSRRRDATARDAA